MAAKRRLHFGTPGRKKRARRTKAARALRSVRRLTRSIELKQREIGNTFTASATPQWICLNNIAQGDSQSLRDGRKVTFKRLKIRQLVTSADTPFNYLRFLVVKMPVGLDGSDLPVWTEMFDNTAPADLDFQFPHRHDQWLHKYKILLNRRVRVNSIEVSGTATNNKRYIATSLNLRNLQTLYSGADSAVGTVEKNQLWMGWVSDSSVSVHPSVDYHLKLYFTDL